MPRIDDDGEEALCPSSEGEGEDETEEPPDDDWGRTRVRS